MLDILSSFLKIKFKCYFLYENYPAVQLPKAESPALSFMSPILDVVCTSFAFTPAKREVLKKNLTAINPTSPPQPLSKYDRLS